MRGFRLRGFFFGVGLLSGSIVPVADAFRLALVDVGTTGVGMVDITTDGGDDGCGMTCTVGVAIDIRGGCATVVRLLLLGGTVVCDDG